MHGYCRASWIVAAAVIPFLGCSNDKRLEIPAWVNLK